MASNADKEYRLRITGDARELGEATKKATASLNTLKQEAVGLGSALTGGLLGGGIAGAVGFAVNLIGEKIRETRDLMRDAERLDISPGSAEFSKNQERLLGVNGTIFSAIENARQQRSEALAGAPASAKAFESIGLSLEKIRNLNPDDLFLSIVREFPKDPRKDQREALRKLLGEKAGAELEGFAAGGFFRSNEVIQAASLGRVMEELTKNNIGKLGAEFQDSPAAVNTRKRFKADFEPLPEFTRDQNAEGRRRANVEIYNQLLRDQLPIQERIKAIRGDIAKADTQIMAMAEGPLRQQEISRQAGRFALLNQLQNGSVAGAPSSAGALATPAGLPSDSFTRVGRYFFGAGDPSLNVGRENLKTLQDVRRLLEKLPKETGREVASNL